MITHRKLFLYALAFILAICALAYSAYGQQNDQIGRVDNTYTVHFSPGGRIDLFERIFAGIAATNGKIIIDGPCYSACTMMVGVVPDICATDRGQLGVHKAWQPTPWGKREYPPGTALMTAHYPPALRAWISSHGGLTKNIKVIKGADLFQIVPKCGPPVSPPTLTP
jgi:hypothetical protein